MLPWSWECLWGCRSGLDPSRAAEPSDSHLRQDTHLCSPVSWRNLPLVPSPASWCGVCWLLKLAVVTNQ